MQSAHQPNAPLHCPRCAYLLAGTESDAASRGDPRGTCPECGLDVSWAELRDTRGDPPWFAESRNARRPLAWRACATALRTTRPFRFWSAVTMQIPLRPRAIAVYLLVVAAAAHAVAVTGRTWMNIERRQQWYSTTPTVADHAWAALMPASIVWGESIWSWTTRRNEGPDDRWTTRTVATAVALAECACTMGFDEDDMGRFTGAGGFQARGRAPRLLDPAAAARLASAAVVPLAAPALVLLLPFSMRRARVRPVHLLRATLYSTALLPPLLAIAVWGTHHGHRFMLGAPTLRGRLEPHIVTLAAIALASVWMSAICTRYLRLPNAIGVAAACTAIAGLLSLGAAATHFGVL